MHLLVMGLGSSFGTSRVFARFNAWLLSFRQTQQRKLWQTAMNEEIPSDERGTL